MLSSYHAGNVLVLLQVLQVFISRVGLKMTNKKKQFYHVEINVVRSDQKRNILRSLLFILPVHTRKV